MDPEFLQERVHEFISMMLASNDPRLYGRIIHANVAPDAILQTPAHSTQGTENIHNLLALHAALSDNTLGDLVWDESTKTAHVWVKTTYALPLDKAPWPISAAGLIRFHVEWDDVQVHLGPDRRVPAPSDATEAHTKYHVTKVSTPQRPPRHRILQFAYHVVMYFVRLIVPHLLPVFITLLKFFERHPLSDGILSVAFAAVYETAQWFITGVLNFLGINLSRHHKPATDVCEDSLDTTTDINNPSEKSSPAPARKASELPKASDLPASAPRSTPSSQAPYTLVPVVDASAGDEQDDDTADDSLRLAPEMGTEKGLSSANTSRSPSPGTADGAEHHKHGDHKKHKKHKRNKQTPHHHAHHQH